jgi:replication factor A2
LLEKGALLTAVLEQNFKNDSLRPVTIKQLNEAESPDNTEFKIDGSPISQASPSLNLHTATIHTQKNAQLTVYGLQVTIIGQVRNISQQTTNITYRLDDGTGVVEVKVWIDPEADTSHKTPIVENTYVRAWGRLKSFSGKKHVGAHFIRPLQDLNEVNYHMLEATLVHLQITRGAVGGGEGGQKALENGGGGGGGGDQLPSTLSGTARRVYETLKNTPSGNEGLHTHDLASRTGLQIAEVQKAGDELLGSGLIYQTVDDDTWQVLNPGTY